MKKQSDIFCDRLKAMNTPMDLWFRKALEEMDGMQKEANFVANELRKLHRDVKGYAREEDVTVTITGELLDQLADRLDGKADRQYCVKIPAEKLALLLGCRHGAIVRRCLPTGAETAFSFVVLNPEDD